MPAPTAQNTPESREFTPLRPLLTEKAAAALLAVSPRTLQSWRVKGGGPKYLKIRTAIRYDPAELAAWVADLNRENTSG
jgi:hypothetical protein